MAQSPFPGMDPYLEAPNLWPDVHSRLMNIFAEQLTPNLAPKYIAELETQIVIDRIQDTQIDTKTVLPDITITQPQQGFTGTMVATPVAPAPLRLNLPVAIPTRLVSIYIRLRETQQIVTVIELLSPVNKRAGSEGRQAYLEKRMTFLESPFHLIEIDLLRKGPRMPFDGLPPKTDYLAMVSNMYEYPACDVWPISLRHPLPVLPVPLLRPDPAVPLDMGQALQIAYQRARYDLRIDYSKLPLPPLSPEAKVWIEALLSEVREENVH